MAAVSHMSLSALTVRDSPRFRRRRSFPLIRAGSSNTGDENNSLLNLKDDVANDSIRYVLKLGVGSVAGAAVIKYGSLLVPQITTPNLPEALFIIITPLIVASIILLAKSKISS